MGNGSRIFDRRETGFLTALFALAILLTLQGVIGALLSTHYHASLSAAHSDVQGMRDGGGFFRFLIGFHYWGSAFLIVGSALTLFVGAWTGVYRNSGRLAWLAGIGFLLCSLGFQFSGNLLPLDRHDVQTVVVESGIVARAPVLGDTLRHAELNGDSFGQPTLDRWMGLHEWLLPAAALLLILLTVVLVRRSGIQPLWPGIAILVVAGLSMLGTPTGPAATALDFNRFDALPSWYSWPMHGSLSLFQALSANLGWIGAFVMPGLFMLLLAALPFLPDRIGARLGRWGLLGFAVYFAIGILGFGGRVAPVIGDQGPAEASPVPVATSSPIDPKLVARGAALFNSVGCMDCHGSYGLSGDVGPALNGEAKKGRDAAWLERFITNPSAIKPGTTMPSFGNKIKPEEIKAIVAFLLRPDPTKAPTDSR